MATIHAVASEIPFVLTNGGSHASNEHHFGGVFDRWVGNSRVGLGLRRIWFHDRKLAQLALSEDKDIAGRAVEQLRAIGPEGLEALVDQHADLLDDATRPAAEEQQAAWTVLANGCLRPWTEYRASAIVAPRVCFGTPTSKRQRRRPRLRGSQSFRCG